MLSHRIIAEKNEQINSWRWEGTWFAAFSNLHSVKYWPNFNLLTSVRNQGWKMCPSGMAPAHLDMRPESVAFSLLSPFHRADHFFISYCTLITWDKTTYYAYPHNPLYSGFKSLFGRRTVKNTFYLMTHPVNTHTCSFLYTHRCIKPK